jgi:hypothetical protein
MQIFDNISNRNAEHSYGEKKGGWKIWETICFLTFEIDYLPNIDDVQGYVSVE